MKYSTRFALPAITLLWLFSNGMISAVAGNNPLVLPNQRLQPAIKVAPGQAQSYHYRAETRARSKKQGKVQTGGLAWQCQGNACTISGPWPTPAVSACQALARQVGAIRSYGHAGKKLSARQLKQCNVGVGKKSPAVAAGIPGLKPALQSPQTRPLPTPVLIKKAQPVKSTVVKRSKTLAPVGVDGTRPPGRRGSFALPAGAGTKAPGLNKPVTGTGGKSLLPPGATGGPRHVLRDGDAPRPGLGGFAPVPGVGANIAHAPVTGTGGTSLLPAQIKLTIDYLVNARDGIQIYLENGRAASDKYIPSDRPLVAQLTVQNLGGEPATVSVMTAGARPTRAISVPPGERKNVRISSTLVEGLILDTAKGPVFSGRYYLVTPTGSTRNFRDANNDDNYANANVRVGSPPDVKIQSISGIHLKTKNMAYFNKGVNNNPDSVSEDVYVDVTLKNDGGFMSEPTKVVVKLRSRGDAIPERKNVSYIKSRGLGIDRTEYVDIPGVPVGGSYTAHVRIGDVPFKLMDVDRQLRERTGPLTHSTRHWHYYAGAGTFACGFPAFDDKNNHHNGWGGSRFIISAQFQGSEAQKQYQGTFRVGSFENPDCGVIPD